MNLFPNQVKKVHIVDTESDSVLHQLYAKNVDPYCELMSWYHILNRCDGCGEGVGGGGVNTKKMLFVFAATDQLITLVFVYPKRIMKLITVKDKKYIYFSSYENVNK